MSREKTPGNAPKSRQTVRRIRTVLPFAAAGLALLAMILAGCATHDPARPMPPDVKTFRVPVGQPWLDSGIPARRGDSIHFEAEGSWGDAFELYGPSGNSKVKKTHLGVSAPAFGLLMKMSSSTNEAFFVGSQTNIQATQGGTLMFRSNTSLPKGLRGEVIVRIMVGPDTDRDRLSDYEEVYLWKTDPLITDSNGNGFSDYEESLTRPRPSSP